MRSELTTLTQQLAALAPALAAAITAAPHWDSPALQQTRAACVAIGVCATVGLELQLNSSDALRVAGAAKLLLVAGRAVLVMLGAADARAPRETWRIQLALQNLLGHQLSALASCLAVLEPCERPEAIAVFAATTAAPGTLLPWLFTTSNALLLALRTSDQGAAPCPGLPKHTKQWHDAVKLAGGCLICLCRPSS